jgi:hypothetical protein
MARFSQRTVNETYRRERDDNGADDAAARAGVIGTLSGIYGEAPTSEELDEAAAHYAATHGDSPIIFPAPDGKKT